MKKKKYEVPQTKYSEVELEQGFMEASIFGEKGEHDEGVTIQNHEFGETHDFSDGGWDNVTF